MGASEDMNEITRGGAYEICPVCGTEKFIPDCELWAFQRWVKEGKNFTRRYFCSWTCLRKYDKEHDEDMEKMRHEAAIKGHRKRREKNG